MVTGGKLKIEENQADAGKMMGRDFSLYISLYFKSNFPITNSKKQEVVVGVWGQICSAVTPGGTQGNMWYWGSNWGQQHTRQEEPYPLNHLSSPTSSKF